MTDCYANTNFQQWTGYIRRYVCVTNRVLTYHVSRMLDLLEDFMALRSIPYARLDGSTFRARRALDIKLVCISALFIPPARLIVFVVPARKVS
jgi:hypothetical protein